MSSLNMSAFKYLFPVAGLALSPVALAMQDQNNEGDAKAQERIQVTGSQIKGVDLEGAQPRSANCLWHQCAREAVGLGVSWTDVVRATATNAAQILKLHDKGVIASGTRAAAGYF